MDLRLEAAALSEMAENIAGDPGFRIPTPDWNRTARTVLTLEWIDGTPLSDIAASTARGLDLKDARRASSSSPSCAMPSATASSMPTCTRAI